ncbi:MAG: hypothetical protein ACR2RE_05280 [Geminicoccaceae bacterium]
MRMVFFTFCLLAINSVISGLPSGGIADIVSTCDDNLVLPGLDRDCSDAMPVGLMIEGPLSSITARDTPLG